MKADSSRTVILAAIEPSAESDQVIHTATALSGIVPGAELHLVHVANFGPPPHELALSLTDLLAEGRAYLDRAMKVATEATPCKVTSHLAVGAPAERILQIASDLSADLIVVGTHEKRGLSRILGSVSHRVLTQAACPVLLARVKEAEPTVPEIEPPCPDCVTVQRETNGEKLWCARHSTRHVHGHLHFAAPAGYGEGSMLLRPPS